MYKLYSTQQGVNRAKKKLKIRNNDQKRPRESLF